MIRPDPSTHLREIFEAEQGFLLRLRTDFVWDKEAFKALSDAMQLYLEKIVPGENIERWAAEGFWYTETFTKDWVSHPSFPKEHSSHYYEKALERLHDLSYWLFLGESPMQNETLKPFSA